jgi:hypothetical protein
VEKDPREGKSLKEILKGKMECFLIWTDQTISLEKKLERNIPFKDFNLVIWEIDPFNLSLPDLSMIKELRRRELIRKNTPVIFFTKEIEISKTIKREILKIGGSLFVFEKIFPLDLFLAKAEEFLEQEAK